MLIPISDAAKVKVDVAAVGGSFAAFFKVIPWPELAACAAFVYTLLRIAEVIAGWIERRRKA